MSEILMPDTVRVVNTPSDYPLELRDAAGAVTTTVGDAAGFRVQGVVNTVTKLADITKLRIQRGLSPQKAQYSVAAADITLTSPVANAKVFVEFHVETVDRIARMNRGTGYEYGLRPIVIDITLAAADTAATVLHKLHLGINAFSENNRDYVFKSTEVGGTAGAPASLTLDFLEKGSFLKKVTVVGENDLPSIYLTGVEAELATPVRKVLKGIGYGDRLEFLEKNLEGNSAAPRFFDFGEIPVKGQLYTEIYWEVEYNRKAPKSSELSNRKGFVIYVSEATGEAYIDAFADLFLTAANIAKMTKLEPVGGISVSFNDAEAIVVAADAAATQIDSTDYKVTYRLGVAAGTAPKYVVLESIAIPGDGEGNATVLAKVKANA